MSWLRGNDMANDTLGVNTTQYYDEYCCNKKKVPKIVWKEIPPLKATYERQPVGGRCQERARQAAARGEYCSKPAADCRKTIYDTDFTATVFSESDRGTHRVRPVWQWSRDPNWLPKERISASTLYEEYDRDPCHRQRFYLYKGMRDPLTTPSVPLAVPDVHKLRYMHNTYMTPYDWY